jgi:FkbM family methyltransferase
MSFASKLRGGLRSLLEPTPLAPIYRSVRDEYAFRQSKFVRNPLGFQFSGHAAMCAGTFETQEVAELKALLEGADVFVDVGANIGYFSCLAASLGKHVVAVEPLAANLRFLLANISMNHWESQVEVFPVGVSDRFGVAKFYGAGTGASLNEGWAGASRYFSTMIALSTLDTLCAKFRNSRIVIKIDVEGAEYAALLGAREVLNYQPAPAWLVEITLHEHRGGAVNADYLRTFDLFFDCGYQCRSVGGREPIQRSDVEAYAKRGGAQQPDWARSGNFIFYRG